MVAGMWTGSGLLFLALLALQTENYVTCIKILKLDSPGPVKNGTVDFVIFDCIYTYDELDTSSLVVKWFLNSNQQPVYQWIPPNPPEASGILSKRVDLEYRASNDNYTMFRALKILMPTIDLHGEYQCQVTSFEDEDDRSANLFVYSPAKFVKIEHTKPSDDTVNVSCYGTGLFPEPSAGMVIFKGNKHNRSPVHDAVFQTSNVDGLYSATIHKVFQDRNLAAEIEFECYFSFPDAGYKVYERLIYYPGPSSSAKQSGNVKSLVLSTEPSLIGIPTVTDTNGAPRFCCTTWLSVLLMVALQMFR